MQESFVYISFINRTHVYSEHKCWSQNRLFRQVSLYLHFEVRLSRISLCRKRNNSDTKISFHDNTFKIRGVVVRSNVFSLMYLFSWCLPSLTFVSSILARSEVSSIQHYVIQFVNFSQHIVGFVYVGSLDCSNRKQNYC